MLTLAQEAKGWSDTSTVNKSYVDRFTALVNADVELSAHRGYIERTASGFGERAFHWLWKLLIDEMPKEFSMLEIGVYKGQVLSLVNLLATRVGGRAHVTGVTLLSSFGGFADEDYAGHIRRVHDEFGLAFPLLIVGDSTERETQEIAALRGPYDIVYVDGCHDYDYVVNDLLFYPTLLRDGGYLVVDDSSCNLHQPFGYFQGIEDVSRAVKDVIESNPAYVHLLAVMHNRVWVKKQP